MAKQTGKLRLTKVTVRTLSETKAGAAENWSTQACISYSNCQACWTE
ncbi:MAG: hypothetical protein AB1941_20810 [Gemmatimonadota bacterium]